MAKESITDAAAAQKILLSEALRTAEARYYYRLNAVLLIASGMSCARVAAALNRSQRTVQDWARRFAEEGLQGLREDDRTGRATALNGNEKRRLESDLRLSPEEFGLAGSRWSGSLLMAHLASQYGKTLSLRQCQRLLREFAVPAAKPLRPR